MYSKHAERPDHVTSEIVESGISLGDEHGLHSAISYLSGCGVPDPVIARVLTAPERRRTMGRMRCHETHMNEEGSRFKFLV